MFIYYPSEFELSEYKKLNYSDISYRLSLAILKMDIIELYSLLDENLTYGWLRKEEFIEKLHTKFLHHQLANDHELVLMIRDQDIYKSSSILYEFNGWRTGFSTSIYFSYKDEKLNELSFLEDQWDIENVLPLYKDELLKK